MFLPFGIQVKGLVVGIVFAYWVLPWLLGFINSRNTPASA